RDRAAAAGTSHRSKSPARTRRRRTTALRKHDHHHSRNTPKVINGARLVQFAFLPTCKIARKAFFGISSCPTCFMRFLPAFCFSSSLRLRVISPPQHVA